MTADLDPARGSAQMSGAALDLSLRLVTGVEGDPPGTGGALEELTRAGILTDGAMADVVARPLRIIAAPALQIAVETHQAEAALVAVIAATPQDGALVERVERDRWLLRSLAPRLVPLRMADVIGIGRRPTPPVTRPLDIPGRALRGAWDAAGRGDTAATERALELAQGVDTAERSAVAALLAHRRLSWRVSVTYTADDGSTRRGSLAAVDGGQAGMWESAPLDAADPEAGVRLTPRGSNELWRRLLALVPPPRRQP